MSPGLRLDFDFTLIDLNDIGKKFPPSAESGRGPGYWIEILKVSLEITVKTFPSLIFPNKQEENDRINSFL
jgi:hypothetical protein